MVVVLKEQKLIFIAEPRTASRSTHQWLVRQGIGISLHGDRERYDRHVGPAEIPEAIENGRLIDADFLKDTLAEYQYFAMLRNPFATAVTYFIQAQRGKLSGSPVACRIARRQRTFIKFLSGIERVIPGWLSEQDRLDRLEHCHYLLRFEDEFPNQIFTFLELHGVQLTSATRAAFPHYGRTQGKRRNWRSYYNAAAREQVARIYAGYCERYNYSFDSD